MEGIREYLKSRGVAATPVRVLVYNQLLLSEVPMSLSDLETLLDSVDKSTIFRTLSTFRDHHLIHYINDGSGSVKYEICHSEDHNNYDDFHVHFRCEKCGETQCLQQVKVPEVKLPSGYQPHEVNYVITGLCPNCCLKK